MVSEGIHFIFVIPGVFKAASIIQLLTWALPLYSSKVIGLKYSVPQTLSGSFFLK